MKYTFTIMLIVLLLLTSCSNQEKNEISEINKEDYTSYLNRTFPYLISKVELDTGGFTIAPTYFQNGNLYATYYNILIKENINVKTDDPSDIQPIINRFFEEDQSVNENLLYELYYITEMVKSVKGLSIKEFNESIGYYLDLLKTESGYFVSSQEEKAFNEEARALHIRYTLLAYSIYENLEVAFPLESQGWLDRMSNNINKDNIDFYDIENISALLHLASLKNWETDISLNDLDKVSLNYITEISENYKEYAIFDFFSIAKVIENLELDIEIPSSVIDYILKSQNPDGTWSLFFESNENNESNEQATYMATYLLNFSNNDIPNQERIKDSIKKAKAFNGGYTSYYNNTEFSLFDTYAISYLGKYLNYNQRNKEETEKHLNTLFNNLKVEDLTDQELVLFSLNSLHYNIKEDDKMKLELLSRINMYSSNILNNSSSIFVLLNTLAQIDPESLSNIKFDEITLDSSNDKYINLYLIGIKMMLNDFDQESFAFLEQILSSDPNLSEDLYLIWILSNIKHSKFYSNFKETDIFLQTRENFQNIINKISEDNGPINLNDSYLIIDILNTY